MKRVMELAKGLFGVSRKASFSERLAGVCGLVLMAVLVAICSISDAGETSPNKLLDLLCNLAYSAWVLIISLFFFVLTFFNYNLKGVGVGGLMSTCLVIVGFLFFAFTPHKPIQVSPTFPVLAAIVGFSFVAIIVINIFCVLSSGGKQENPEKEA